MSLSSGGWFIDELARWLEAWGYRYIEIPSLVNPEMFSSCVEGTDNKMFVLSKKLALIPEVTNYVRTMGAARLGSNKVYYVCKCFRDESTTDSERLREFTQVGVELLGENALDCRKTVRSDALKLFKKILPAGTWQMDDDVKRGLNLYDNSGKAFEISSPTTRKQLLGGGPYEGGAGWALGLERFMKVKNAR